VQYSRNLQNSVKNPGLHDDFPQGFGNWKEQYTDFSVNEQWKNNEKNKDLEKEEVSKAIQDELKLEQKLHNKSRSDSIIKVFSEKISPEVHHKAVVKGGFGFWKEDALRHIHGKKTDFIRKRILVFYVRTKYLCAYKISETWYRNAYY
jgi:hypothetical protein